VNSVQREVVSEYELDRMWEDAVAVYFEVLSQNLTGQTEENHENFSTGFEPRIFRMRKKSATHSTAKFCKLFTFPVGRRHSSSG
jgi:hypothetical protein